MQRNIEKNNTDLLADIIKNYVKISKTLDFTKQSGCFGKFIKN